MATATKRRMVTLRGLEGVKRLETKAVGVVSVTDALKFIRQGKTVTSAGDDGSITVWRDDEGKLQCRFHVYKTTRGSLTTDAVVRVAEWLKQYWPLMRRD